MKRKILTLLLKGKIEMEYKEYVKKLYGSDVEDLISFAYEISCYQTIQMSLLKLLPSLSLEVIQLLLSIDQIIGYFYYSWDNREPDRPDSISAFMRKNLVSCQQNMDVCDTKRRVSV